MHIPEDLEQMIKDIVIYEELLKEEQDEEGLEYLYDYVDDYSQYPEYDENGPEEKSSTVIHIDL